MHQTTLATVEALEPITEMKAQTFKASRMKPPNPATSIPIADPPMRLTQSFAGNVCLRPGRNNWQSNASASDHVNEALRSCLPPWQLGGASPRFKAQIVRDFG